MSLTNNRVWPQMVISIANICRKKTKKNGIVSVKLTKNV